MYTKGEWYTEEDEMEEVSILSIPEGEDFPDTIATVRLIGSLDGTEMLANANLITATPLGDELAKAIIDQGKDGLDRSQWILQKAREFRAKVKGSK